MKKPDILKRAILKKIYIILIVIVLIIIAFLTILILNRNNISYNIGNKTAKETEKENIELSLEIKGETENDYNCLLTFTSNDENNKIKSIEYPVKDGETNPHVLNVKEEEGKDKIVIDYKLVKGDENKTFKVTTTRWRHN